MDCGSVTDASASCHRTQEVPIILLSVIVLVWRSQPPPCSRTRGRDGDGRYLEEKEINPGASDSTRPSRRRSNEHRASGLPISGQLLCNGRGFCALESNNADKDRPT